MKGKQNNRCGSKPVHRKRHILKAAVLPILACLGFGFHANADVIYYIQYGQGYNVYGFNVSTRTTSLVVSGGTTQSTLDITEPSALAIGPDGNIYVGNSNNGDVVKVTPAGAASPYYTANSPDTLGMVFDQSGNLYLSQYNLYTRPYYGSVERITPGGAAESVVVTGLEAPTVETTDPAGNVYATTTGNSTSNNLTQITPSGTTSTFQTGIYGTVFDMQGNYFTTYPSGAVTYTTSGGITTSLASGFTAPVPLSADGHGGVYVEDILSSSVEFYSISASGQVTLLDTVPESPGNYPVIDATVALPDPSIAGLALLFIFMFTRRRRGHWVLSLPRFSSAKARQSDDPVYDFGLRHLEGRVCLSATINSETISAIVPGTTEVPWQQNYTAGTVSGTDQVTGDEQLLSTCVVPVSGITAVLVQVQDFGPNDSTWQGTTSLRLYVCASDSNQWHEIDINMAFDGQGDVRPASVGPPPTPATNEGRKDDQMDPDSQGNLYLETDSDYSILEVDRIPADMLEELAAGETLAPPPGGTQILPASDVAITGQGNLQPQMTVGTIPASTPGGTPQTVVYLFCGNPSSTGYKDPNGYEYSVFYRWIGTDDDSFANPNGQTNPNWQNYNDYAINPATGAALDVGGGFSGMTVGGDGTYYGWGDGLTEIYSLPLTATNVQSVSSFTPIIAGPSGSMGTALGVENQLVSYTTGGVTTLYTLVDNSSGEAVSIDSTPLSGSGAGTWTEMAPFDAVKGTSTSSPFLAIDPANGQLSILYENSTTALSVATLTSSGWITKVVAPSVTFGGGAVNGGGNDHTFNLWLSVYDNQASVAYTQNDPTLSGAEDVAAFPVSLTATGDVLQVTDTTGDPITISGSALAGGTANVTVDGSAYPLTLTHNLIETVVTSPNGAAVTVDETAGDPIPGIDGMLLDETGAAGSLKIEGCDNAALSGSEITTAAGAITLVAGVPSVELDLDGSANAITVGENMNAPSVSSLLIVGSANTVQLTVQNGGSTATGTIVGDVLDFGGFSFQYDCGVSNLTISSPGTLSFDVAGGSDLPSGTAASPGLIGLDGLTADVTASGGNALSFALNTAGVWLAGGCYFEMPVTKLDLTGAGNSTVTLASENFPPPNSPFEVDLGTGSNVVAIALPLYSRFASTGAQTVPINIYSGSPGHPGSGNNQVTVTGTDTGTASPPLTYYGGAGTDLFTAEENNFNNFTFDGGTGNETLECDYSHGQGTPAGSAAFNGSAAGNNTVIYLGSAGNDTLKASASSITFSAGTTHHDSLAISHVNVLDFPGGSGGNDTLEIAGGSYDVNADTPTGTANVDMIVDSGATATFTDDQHLKSLTVNDGGIAQVMTADPCTLTIYTLTIDGAGYLDLGAGGMGYGANLLTQTHVGLIRTYLTNGYDGGTWAGTGGIRSGVAANEDAANGQIYALGYVTYDDAITALGLQTDEILVCPTLYGDANLSHTVDFIDFNVVASNYGSTGNDWANGDFNYSSDGTVDFNDFNLLANNYLATYPS